MESTKRSGCKRMTEGGRLNDGEDVNRRESQIRRQEFKLLRQEASAKLAVQ